ncbi:MAG: 50S ribosomal protein L9 [Bdellovibrionota bacterium]
MRVILKENIENLGNVGDVIDVRDGYARNYLLPKGLVLAANEGNVTAWKHQQRVVADRIRKLRLSAEKVAEQMKDLTVQVDAKAGEGDRLFGSVGTSDIQKALKGRGFTVNRRDIQLERPIKTVGIHHVNVRLHPELVVEVKVDVVKIKEPEAPVSAKKTKTQEILEAAEREEAAKKAAEEPAASAEEAAPSAEEESEKD